MSEPQTNLTAIAGSSPVPCSPSSDAGFIAQAKKWCEDLGNLSDGEIVCKLADLLAEKYAALSLLAELHAALVQYEGDVDGDAPSEHRRMMKRAAAILPANAGVLAHADEKLTDQ